MAPSKVTDPNGTESTAVFDALGRVTKTAVRNTVGGNAFGDGATEYSGEFIYNTTSLPASVHSKVRKEYGGTAAWQESYAYSDGGGNVIQTKVQAAPGLAPERDVNGDLVFDGGGALQWAPADPRWVGSGRVIIDNKGNTVKQYEPFFSSLSTFEDEDEVAQSGVSAILSYDPIGRNTRIDLPDGNVRSWSYDPWKVVASDENDNIDDADTTNPGYDHRGTPTTTHLDAQGRVYKSVALPDRIGTEHVTQLELDILGNPLTVTDPRGNDIQIQQFDVLGRPAFTGAADEGYDPSIAKGSNTKGKSWLFAQVDGQTERSWRSGGLETRQVYDTLRRPREMYVDEGAGERLVTLTIYGDELTDTADASTVEDDFLKGKPAHVYDTAGRVTFAYDFRGLTLSQSRQVITDIDVEADWSDNGTDPTGLEDESTLAGIATWLGKLGTPEKLDTETFTVSSTFDARGLVKTSTSPDSTVTSYTYDAGGRLSEVSGNIHGSTTQDFVDEITYNARGQRKKIRYANHTETLYTYDDERFRLMRVLTKRLASSPEGIGTLQDLKYTYDPVGNITKIVDDAQQTLYFDNAQVSPDRVFTYDALYRLTEATGREKRTLKQTQAWDPTLGDITDAAPTNIALRRYTQKYTYDAAGNITVMEHVSGGTTEWKRGYDYQTDNNQLKATSNVGPSTPDVFGTPSTYSDTYSYNDRGAMTFMPQLNRGTGVTTNVTRDFRDHIRKAELQGGTDYVFYAYDAAGIRVRKKCFKGTGGNITEERIYIGSGYEVWRKRTSTTLDEERETLHVMDDTRRICMVETETTASPSATRYRFQYADHLGTACVETDEDGAIITYEEFHPYGSTAWWAEKSGIQVSRKRYRYTGMEKDEETGLSYHNARYYMTWLGRWERPDPIGLGDGLNRFEYVGGYPHHRDISGFKTDNDITEISQPTEYSELDEPNPIVNITDLSTNPFMVDQVGNSLPWPQQVSLMSIADDLQEVYDIHRGLTQNGGKVESGSALFQRDNASPTDEQSVLIGNTVVGQYVVSNADGRITDFDISNSRRMLHSKGFGLTVLVGIFHVHPHGNHEVKASEADYHSIFVGKKNSIMITSQDQSDDVLIMVVRKEVGLELPRGGPREFTKEQLAYVAQAMYADDAAVYYGSSGLSGTMEQVQPSSDGLSKRFIQRLEGLK